MQVISVAFKLTIYEFWGMESELLGILEQAVIEYSSSFSWKITESYPFFSISRLRRLHLACSVE
jgi:hypothetical protein